jgi:methyltransferase (TIGR00027 family)
MKKDQTSITALGIAISRAVESEKPAEERICYDPIARQFVPGWMFHFTSFFMRSGYAEWRGPGVNGYLAARERYIDDFLARSLEKGLEQVVILGAGYDSRAYRFADRLAGVKVFEVDHPATQKDKLARLEKIFGRQPEHVVYVPVDFNTQSLEDRLDQAGYNPALKTLFIWQGVTMYLTAEAVDRTLDFVRRCSAPGSKIIFDYIDRSLLDNRETHSEVKGMRRYRFMTGEGLTFGIEAGKVEDFLKSRGFREVENIRSEELKGLYFTGKNASRKVTGGYGIAAAMV